MNIRISSDIGDSSAQKTKHVYQIQRNIRNNYIFQSEDPRP